MELASFNFVNRKEELGQVSEAVEILQDEQRLLRTPIIEFCGVQGIGKTTLLQQVKAICGHKNVTCRMADAKQMATYGFEGVESLTRGGPVTIILDALDEVDNEQLQAIETRLDELIESTRLFVVLASRNEQKFERIRSLASKLTIRSLEPLDYQDCLSYLDKSVHSIPPVARDIIFEWTRGYPLAMRVMVEAIQEKGLNPALELDQKKLIGILMEEVIENNLLANVSLPEERIRLQTLLPLLSIPRRFNLILMKILIEKFASQYALRSSLAYMTLPPEINKLTSVLNWRMERGGYCIEAPVRNLFLLQYKVERPQQLVEIHRFLAEKNKDFSQQVAGPDRIRFLREFFYHLASYEDETKVKENLIWQIGQLAQLQQNEDDTLRSMDGFLQFYEEFRQDQELKEVLGQHNTAQAFSLMYEQFLEIYRQLPVEEKGKWLKEFFSHIIQQSKNGDFAFIFEYGFRQIIQQVPKERAIKLYNGLIEDASLKAQLGERFEAVRSRIESDLVG